MLKSDWYSRQGNNKNPQQRILKLLDVEYFYIKDFCAGRLEFHSAGDLKRAYNDVVGLISHCDITEEVVSEQVTVLLFQAVGAFREYARTFRN